MLESYFTEQSHYHRFFKSWALQDSPQILRQKFQLEEAQIENARKSEEGWRKKTNAKYMQMQHQKILRHLYTFVSDL